MAGCPESNRSAAERSRGRGRAGGVPVPAKKRDNRNKKGGAQQRGVGGRARARDRGRMGTRRGRQHSPTTPWGPCDHRAGLGGGTHHVVLELEFLVPPLVGAQSVLAGWPIRPVENGPQVVRNARRGLGGSESAIAMRARHFKYDVQMRSRCRAAPQARSARRAGKRQCSRQNSPRHWAARAGAKGCAPVSAKAIRRAATHRNTPSRVRSSSRSCALRLHKCQLFSARSDGWVH